MAANGVIPLTVDNVAEYISERSEAIGVFASDAKLSVSAIIGGNVNYAFCVKDETGQSVFVKQAPEYVAIFGPDGLPLTSTRMLKEHGVYMEWQSILGETLSKKYLPEIYLFDDHNKVFVMEFFDGFTLLDHELVTSGVVPSSISTGLGEFMGKTHAATHSTMIEANDCKNFTTKYENRAMRDIQLEYVFTKCYKEATDEQRAGLNVDDAFMKEIDDLKLAYDGKKLNNDLCLTHGDLHPGSVMVNQAGDVKVIDPEFTIYGPPGLDVGSLLSGYILAAVHQAHAKKPEAVKSLIDASVAVWTAYQIAMQGAGVSSDTLQTIECSTVGFACAEVCRTALGFAGGRLWLQFEDEVVKKAAIKDALTIVGKCMIGRHEGGIALLFSAIQELVAK